MHFLLHQPRATLLFCLLLLTPTPDMAAEPAVPRVRLLFSVEQGFGNGLVVNGDLEAVSRICRALKMLRPRYEVYALFNPRERRFKKLLGDFRGLITVCYARVRRGQFGRRCV